MGADEIDVEELKVDWFGKEVVLLGLNSATSVGFLVSGRELDCVEEMVMAGKPLNLPVLTSVTVVGRLVVG